VRTLVGKSVLQCVAVSCIAPTHGHECIHLHVDKYGVATISRLPKNIGLFCKRALEKRLHSAEETYIFKEPTSHSHPIGVQYHTRTLPIGVQYHTRTSVRTYMSTRRCIVRTLLTRRSTISHTHTLVGAHCATLSAIGCTMCIHLHVHT